MPVIITSSLENPEAEALPPSLMRVCGEFRGTEARGNDVSAQSMGAEKSRDSKHQRAARCPV